MPIDLDSLIEILCNTKSKEKKEWNVLRSDFPERRHVLLFENDGRLSVELFDNGPGTPDAAFNRSMTIPEQTVEGFWQYDGEFLYISYTYKFPNMNTYGQIFSWISCPTNITLKITTFDKKKINCVAVLENNYTQNYQMFFRLT